MSDKKKINLCKPPVPARPKNLLVLNSKHLPKPPETFLSDNVTSVIKVLNLNEKDEIGRKRMVRNSGEAFDNSDSEEDTYSYLEPVSLSAMNLTSASTIAKVKTEQQKVCGLEENSKTGDTIKKVITKYNSNIIETQKMWEDFFFYLKVAKPVGANLGRRLTHEMADIGFNFRKRLQKTSKTQTGSKKCDLDIISEDPEIEESKPHIPQSQQQRPLPSLPLPPTETKSIVANMPWFKNVDRKGGEEILKNGIDGYFLIRPSSNANTYLTLTLWHSTRVYNIPIRKRKDGKFALGTPKTHEQCFDSVEYLVKNYQSEKLLLYSNGIQTGKTLLTSYPP